MGLWGSFKKQKALGKLGTLSAVATIITIPLAVLSLRSPTQSAGLQMTNSPGAIQAGRDINITTLAPKPCGLHEFHIPAIKWNTGEGDVHSCGGTNYTVMISTEPGPEGKKQRFLRVRAQPKDGQPIDCDGYKLCLDGSTADAMFAGCALIPARASYDCTSPDEVRLSWALPNL